MQVQCPANCAPGQTIMVGVPAASMMLAQPAMMQQQQMMPMQQQMMPMQQQMMPMMPVASPSMVGTSPAPQPVTPPAAPVSAAPAAPQPKKMSRGTLDNRMDEVIPGWYAVSPCPCMYCGYVGVEADYSKIKFGPCCVCCCCCMPCTVGEKEAIEPGASHFKPTGDGGEQCEPEFWFTHINTLQKRHACCDGPEGTEMKRCC